MKLLSSALSLLLAGSAFTVRCANTGDSSPALDPAFAAGLATLKQATGFIEDPQSPTDWKSNLQLLVGVKAVEHSKRTIYFVQLTTLPPPPPTNSEPWQPILRTNDWAWSASNKAQFVTTLYPVRVRVFDETGRRLKEGQTPMAWGMLTNGLMDMCRVSMETYRHEKQTNSLLTLPDSHQEPRSSGSESAHAQRNQNSAARHRNKFRSALREQGSEDSLPIGTGEGRGEGKESDAPKPQDDDELMRAAGGGFLWMFGMLHDLQTVPAVANVWAKAQCAIRWPSAWTLATSLVAGLTLSVEPRLKEVTLASAATAGHAGRLYRLPVDLKSGNRNLTRVEIIVGPAHGAEMLLAGIRSIRAAHPTRPKQEFLAQVLAAGMVREP